MALSKQAKILSDKQVGAVLRELGNQRYPARDRTMFLLSIKAGMRAIEIARVTWNMVTDAERARKQDLKRKRGGRIIPVHPDLKSALIALLRERDEQARANLSVIFSERARGLSAGAVTVWFFRLYTGLNMVGCSSHSGRRTFLTKAARRVSEVGASLRDFQQLAGHANLATTRPTRTPSGNWWCWYKPVFLTRSTPGRR